MSPDEELFRDHFPGFAVVPGVLLTEMIAQAVGKCLIVEAPERGRPMLAQIKAATFRHWVRPGQKVTLLGEIQTSRPQFATASCKAEADGALVCSADLMFSFLPKGQLRLEVEDEVLARFLLRGQGDSNGITSAT